LAPLRAMSLSRQPQRTAKNGAQFRLETCVEIVTAAGWQPLAQRIGLEMRGTAFRAGEPDFLIRSMLVDDVRAAHRQFDGQDRALHVDILNRISHPILDGDHEALEGFAGVAVEFYGVHGGIFRKRLLFPVFSGRNAWNNRP